MVIMVMIAMMAMNMTGTHILRSSALKSLGSLRFLSSSPARSISQYQIHDQLLGIKVIDPAAENKLGTRQSPGGAGIGTAFCGPFEKHHIKFLITNQIRVAFNELVFFETVPSKPSVRFLAPRPRVTPGGM